MFASSRKSYLTAIVLLTLSVGCSSEPPRLEVRGQVHLDGSPAADVQLAFWTEDRQTGGAAGTATTDANGEFQLQGDTGLPEGEYKVTLEKYALPAGVKLGGDEKPSEIGAINVIPSIYGSPKTTPSRLISPNSQVLLEISTKNSVTKRASQTVRRFK